MRKLAWLTKAALGAAVVFVASSWVWAEEYVHGYSRHDGTYVQPHWRSNPDGNPYNNWSLPGNVNPHTGRRATGNVGAYLRNGSPRLWGSRSR